MSNKDNNQEKVMGFYRWIFSCFHKKPEMNKPLPREDKFQFIGLFGL
jgi:hypothetical protein